MVHRRFARSAGKRPGYRYDFGFAKDLHQTKVAHFPRNLKPAKSCFLRKKRFQALPQNKITNR